jgi:hypothetical protein
LPCSIAKRERAAVEKGFFGHDGMMLHPIKFPTRNSDALTAKIPVWQNSDGVKRTSGTAVTCFGATRLTLICHCRANFAVMHKTALPQRYDRV